jgi:flap endonuclease-1
VFIFLLQAPSEAEAQCAELARGGKVYAAGTEDMDTLTFNSPTLYRHLTFSEAKKQPIAEISLKAALEGLQMEMSQVRRGRSAWNMSPTLST